MRMRRPAGSDLNSNLCEVLVHSSWIVESLRGHLVVVKPPPMRISSFSIMIMFSKRRKNRRIKIFASFNGRRSPSSFATHFRGAHRMNKLSTAHNFRAEMSNLKSKPPPPLLLSAFCLLHSLRNAKPSINFIRFSAQQQQQQHWMEKRKSN